MSAYDRLIGQIDGFIRKFYKNQIIKGILIFIGILLVTYLTTVTLEYFGRFSSLVRGALLFSFLGVNGYILVRYIVIPLLRLRSFGARINRYQAATIIGNFFPEVSDRLLNTLQLQDQLNENSADYELLNASVQQRSAKMSVMPFAEAIDFGENKKYLRWVLPVAAVLLCIGVLAPSFFKQGTQRVFNFSQEFKVPAPFEFSFLAKERSVIEGDNFPFEVELVGNKIPDKVYVKTAQGRSLLKRESKNRFSGELVQVREKTSIQFEASEFASDRYGIDVISKSAIGKMQATLVFPKYLGMENEVIENAADLVLPEGTAVEWSVLVKNSKSVTFKFGEAKKTFESPGFKYSTVVRNSAAGSVVLVNGQTGKRDTTAFNVDVIKDGYPSIVVEEEKDTLKDGVRYFTGIVGDDHGVSGLKFVYTITSKSGKSRTETMKVGKVTGTEVPFDFAVDFRREKISLEDRIEYYFVVSDNDGVNGAKSTKSRSFTYKLPSLEDLNDRREEDQEKAKEDLNKVLNKVDQFKKDLKKLKNEIRDSKQSNWNKMNQVEQLKEDQRSIIQDLQRLEQQMQNSVEEKNQLSEVDEELLEKQEMVNDLLEELMDEELKDLLDQLQKLMEKNDREKMKDAMDKIEMSADDMKRQLDRSMEMLKRLQVNEKIDDIEEELKKLATEQEKLSEETKKGEKVSEQDKKKQDELTKKFDELKDDLKKLDSLNSELKNPMELGDPEKKSEEVSDEQKDAKDKLDNNKSKKASESQKSAAEKMKEMAETLDAMQQESNQEQQAEDMEMLRNILESLVTLSFEQEDVMKRLTKVQDGDPAYKKYSREQRRIVDDTKGVRDSLYALAERQPKIATFIDAELTTIQENHRLALTDLDEFQEQNRRSSLATHQQYVMTSYNNLALMLNESLQQMQQQMQAMMQGSGSCDKPGGKGAGKPSNSPSDKMGTGDMKEMLKQQLEQMKKGSNPGGKKPGESPGDGQGEGGMGLGNKEIAKMAAQQAAMRKRLEEMRKEMNKDGNGLGNGLNPLIKELEEQEKDLVNKRFSNNMIQRQKDILTRLLESEKALMERGWDEKRESKEGKNENLGNQIRFDQYNKEKLKQIELLQSVDPMYKKYYKDRANEYFNRTM